MASDAHFVDYVLEQVQDASSAESRKILPIPKPK
jgi:hypothetical protein